MKQLFNSLVAIVVLGSLTGCAAFRANVSERDPETSPSLRAGYDQRDLIGWTDEMAEKLLAQFPPEGDSQPIVASFGIQNRTKEHLDTQALDDAITTKLLDSGRVRLVNTTQRDTLLREQGYQLANVTPETRVSVGKQLGAKYMLTGSLTQIDQRSAREVRLSRKQDVFFRLTLEVTEIETGLILLRKQVERMRRERTPIIGW